MIRLLSITALWLLLLFAAAPASGVMSVQPRNCTWEETANGYDVALDVRDGPNVYAYCVQNPWTGFDADGLFTLGVHVEQARVAGLGAGMTAGHELQGMISGVLYPDLKVPIPLKDIPVQYAGAAMKYMDIKNYIPDKLNALGKKADHAWDRVQNFFGNKVLPGSVELRQDVEKTWNHTSSPIIWNAIGQAGSTGADIASTHTGAKSPEHFMAAPGMTAKDVQGIATALVMYHYAGYQTNMAKGDAYEAGFHMGQALHLVEDSWSPAHTGRSPGTGNIVEVGVFSAQSPQIHSQLDDPVETHYTYKGAVSASQKMIQMFRGGTMNPLSAASFFPMASGARVGPGAAAAPADTKSSEQLMDKAKSLFSR